MLKQSDEQILEKDPQKLKIKNFSWRDLDLILPILIIILGFFIERYDKKDKSLMDIFNFYLGWGSSIILLLQSKLFKKIRDYRRQKNLEI